jgi:hypothetical protein
MSFYDLDPEEHRFDEVRYKVRPLMHETCKG